MGCRMSKPIPRPQLPKLPMLEWAYRWVNVLTYFDYPASVGEEAIRILTEHAVQMTLGHPSLAANIAVVIACERLKVPYRHERTEKIKECFLAHRKQRYGATSGGSTGTERLMKRVEEWKNIKEVESI